MNGFDAKSHLKLGLAQMPASSRTDTLVVGAGPQALTVLGRWLSDRPACLHNLLVVDPAGTWMRTWKKSFAQQSIDVLRSPGVHHPDPDEMAFVNAYPQGEEFKTDSLFKGLATSIGPLRRPTTAAFGQFCQDLLCRTGLVDRVIPATVTGLRLCSGPDCDYRWEVRLDNGAEVKARQVLWAGNPRALRRPSEVRFSESILHSVQVDLRQVVPDQRIAVLGGGQTAGQLALGAARRGAEVILVSRGPRRIADLDVDAGWLMEDRLMPFRSIESPIRRRRVVELAQRGSITADLDSQLCLERVQRISTAGDLSAWNDSNDVIVGFAGIECRVDQVWSATGSCADLRVDPALALFAEQGAPHVDGWPVLDKNLDWGNGLAFVGGLAALTLGPAAGNLGGARAAAEILASRGPRVGSEA